MMRADGRAMASLNPHGNVTEPLLKRVNRLSTRLSTLDRQSILRIGEISGHGGNRFYNVIMDFIIFVVTACEITVVLYLSIHHFLDSTGSDLMALAMLIPILLNFVGVTYFLSDKSERRELEEASGSSKCSTDFLQLPILGPVFTALKILRVSCGCSTRSNYERLEASAIKMRQGVGFFSAAPEALIQLTVLLTTEPKELSFDSILEMFAVILFTITLAESNCYNPFSKYYQMFKVYEPNDWRLTNVELWQKIILFLHAFSSIGLRIIASASLKASALYFCKDRSFPLVITITVFGEIVYRIILFYISRCLKFFVMGKEVPSGCYESITYAWRSTILDYSFQSDNLATQILFYVENILCFTLWVVSVQLKFHSEWVKDTLLYPLSIIFASLTVVSVLSIFTCNYFRLINIGSPFRGRRMPDV